MCSGLCGFDLAEKFSALYNAIPILKIKKNLRFREISTSDVYFLWEQNELQLGQK